MHTSYQKYDSFLFIEKIYSNANTLTFALKLLLMLMDVGFEKKIQTLISTYSLHLCPCAVSKFAQTPFLFSNFPILFVDCCWCNAINSGRTPLPNWTSPFLCTQQRQAMKIVVKSVSNMLRLIY
jgi:hypothetical protein